MRPVALGCAVICLGLGAACASLDATEVEAARAAVATASADSSVDASRSLHFQEARRHLALAEEALEAARWQEEADHEAYMATTLANVAVARGQARALDAAASGALDQARRETRDTQLQVARAARRARALQAKETERGLVLTLGGVLFSFDSAELKQEAHLSAARVAGFLIASDDREVVVEGYTDNVGTDEYNRELSAQRANAVRLALIAAGVEAGRIASGGHGPMYAVSDNESEEGRARNRRVEIVILEPGESAATALRGR
jgi:outer membrane protein OmpA-like peptidoglycan-associated protein